MHRRLHDAADKPGTPADERVRGLTTAALLALGGGEPASAYRSASRAVAAARATDVGGALALGLSVRAQAGPCRGCRAASSIEGPTGLVGWSLGADVALAATGAQSRAVDAVAPVDPVLPGLRDEPAQAAFGDVVARMGELTADDRLTAAVRAFAGFVFNDEDIAVAENAGYFEAAGRYVPNLLSFLHQQMEYQGPSPDDPAVLRAISAPVLVLLGSDTEPYATAAARHVVDHVRNARLHEIPGAGHAAPLTHPEALAQALSRFFSPAQQPV